MLFFFSNDQRYVIKTITRAELKFFRKILKSYMEHMQTNINSLLPRFFGLCKLRLPGTPRPFFLISCYIPRDFQRPDVVETKGLRFVVMNNLFDTSVKLHEKYDLKGSTRNR